MEQKNFSNVTIDTERLKLRSVRVSDAEDIFREFTPNVAKFMAFAPVKTLEEQLVAVRRSMEESERGNQAVLVFSNKETGEFVGRGGFWRTSTGTPEIGIWIKESAQEVGYGKEIVAGLITWARDNLNYDYLIYPVYRRNTRSRRLAKSLGGQREPWHKRIMSPRKVTYRFYPKSS